MEGAVLFPRTSGHIQLAEHLGVDKQMVTKWERSGMPVHTRGRGVASQFRLGEVRAWLRVRKAKAKAAEKAKKTAKGTVKFSTA